MAGSVFLRTALVLSAAVSPIFAADQSAKDSPFLPPPGAAAPAQAGPAAYTLGGMTVHGKETLLSITRESDKRSTWIPLGKTVGDITVVSYDPKKDEAIIRAGGREHVLPMRKSVIVSAPAAPVQTAQALPAPAPSNTAAAVPPAPEPVKMPPMNQQEEKEMEARMLVSDLLEIGQQQRRAYEAAQREAAAKAAAESRAKSAQK